MNYFFSPSANTTANIIQHLTSMQAINEIWWDSKRKRILIKTVMNFSILKSAGAIDVACDKEWRIQPLVIVLGYVARFCQHWTRKIGACLFVGVIQFLSLQKLTPMFISCHPLFDFIDWIVTKKYHSRKTHAATLWFIKYQIEWTACDSSHFHHNIQWK